MKYVKIFISLILWILASCGGALLGYYITKYTGLRGELNLVPAALGFLIGAKLAGKLAGKLLYKGTAQEINGHPLVSILTWLAMFLIIAVVILFVGSRYLP